MTTTIFLTGATGYIGGAILFQLLQDKTYHISALLRAKDKAEKLEKLGVRVVLGSLDDKALIAEEAYKANVVIHLGDCDHLVSARAIVEGLQKKFKETGKKSIYIHTSGSGILSVDTRGNSASEKIFDDLNTADLNAIPLSQPHRNVDTFILARDAAYHLVIIAPTTIYGRGHYLEGISNLVSTQIPLAIKAALKHKKPQQIGKGLNIWSNVHVDDVADLYILLLRKLLKGELKGDDLGYYFAENGEHAWKQIHEEIAGVLHSKGIIKDTSINEVNTNEEITEAFGFPEALYFIGGNSRAKANKARKNGWSPKYGGDDVFKSIEADVDYLLSQEKK